MPRLSIVQDNCLGRRSEDQDGDFADVLEHAGYASRSSSLVPTSSDDEDSRQLVLPLGDISIENGVTVAHSS